jgi:hypothetical protein
MNNQLGVAVLCLSLCVCTSGCAGVGSPVMPFGAATRAYHRPIVTVQQAAPGSNVIKVDPDVLTTRGANNTIDWKIDPNLANHQFLWWPSNGIVFVDANAPFRCWKQNEQLFRCEGGRDDNVTMKYKYMVTLDGTPVVPPLDPFVVNN